MDALTLLREDHQQVKQLFGEIEQTEDATQRQQLFDQLLVALKAHERIEEEIFYPAVEERAKQKELKDMLIESYVEHGFVDRIAADIEECTKPNTDVWKAKVKVMKENVEHHAFEEEEGKLFPKVQEMFEAKELEDLGTEMEDLKEEAIDELEEAMEASS